MPDGIDESARAANEIKDILQSLGKIAHSLGPIRNAYGKGHGRGRNFKGLEARHARLAIGAASTFVDFVLDRHLQSSKDVVAERLERRVAHPPVAARPWNVISNDRLGPHSGL